MNVIQFPTKLGKAQARKNNIRNLEAYQAAEGRRTSGAAGKHLDKRDKRTRTRQAQMARALKDA